MRRQVLSEIRWSLKYAWTILKHKYFFAIAAWKVGKIGLRRILAHDLSKFSWAELRHYGRQFYGEPKDSEAWDRCWLHHQNLNDHHWEYWIPRKKLTVMGNQVPQQPLPMPEVCVREMVADWMAASRAYTGDWDMECWLIETLPRLNLHPETLGRVERILKSIGYEGG